LFDVGGKHFRREEERLFEYRILPEVQNLPCARQKLQRLYGLLVRTKITESKQERNKEIDKRSKEIN
jgi:hypothetical protein